MDQVAGTGGTFVKEYSGEILFSPLFPMIALDRTDLLNVLEYRRIAEMGTAALVAEKTGEKEIEDLEAAYREMLHRKENLHAFASADIDFPLALARATGNPIVIKVNGISKSVLGAFKDRIVSPLGVSDGLACHRGGPSTPSRRTMQDRRNPSWRSTCCGRSGG